MSKLSEAEREELVRESRDAALRASFAESARVCEAWERAHPVGLEGILEWIDQLRALFGEPPVDGTPWRGDDLRAC